MTFLDTFKKNPFAYTILLSLGITVLLINNLFQLLDYIQKNKIVILISLIVFTLFVIYIAFNKEEVLK